VGKTLWAQNLIVNIAPEPCLIFEMELPDAMMFERFVSMETSMATYEVEAAYKNGQEVPWRTGKLLKHFSLCGQSGLSVEQIQDIVLRSELRMGVKPSVVVVDYIGLVKGEGRTRYERTSFVVEQLKVMAKTTGTIVVAMCQRHRKEGEDGTAEVGLHDAKDTGSIENSGQVVLGAWRDADEPELMHVRLLKCNKGGAGKKIVCRLNPKNLRIQELSDTTEPEPTAADLQPG
jgi:replicative DNA helicase